MKHLTIDTDDVLTLLTGAKAGETSLGQHHDTRPLRLAIERVEALVLRQVDAGLPVPVNPAAERLAERVVAELAGDAGTTEDELMRQTGLDRNNLAVALAKLEADGRAIQLVAAGEPTWRRT